MVAFDKFSRRAGLESGRISKVGNTGVASLECDLVGLLCDYF